MKSYFFYKFENAISNQFIEYSRKFPNKIKQ